MRPRLLAALAALLLLSGCTEASREPDHLKVMRLVAADGVPEAVTLTAFPAPAGEDGEAPPPSPTGRGATAAEAALALSSDGGSLAFLGHTEHLLLSDRLAERGGAVPLLECAAFGDALRPDAYLWLVRGDSAAAWGEAAKGDEAAQALTDRCTDAGARRRTAAWTAAQTLNKLLRSGAAPVPLLLAGGEDPAGYALLTSRGVAGTLEGEAADGLELLLGMTCQHTIPTESGTLELTKVRTTVRPNWNAGAFDGLTVTCTLTARRANGGGASRSAPVPAEHALRAWGTKRLTAAHRALCALGADGGEFYTRASAAAGIHQRALREGWPAALSGLRVTWEVRVHIDD